MKVCDVMKTELLAPAGSFETFKHAIFSGADAIYLAGSMYGARAYAKNLTMIELDEALDLAHSLNKKIYVTVNTLVKDSELEDCYNYLNDLYKLGVDGVIAADFAIINYIITKLPNMECHISTQVGIKDLNDTLFFENLGAKRAVLARELSLEEITTIKENTNIALEVFGHGALCVSYSGGCLMSSFLSLRSGNRGRCSQNCRREYTLYKNGKILGEEGYYLSMKDLDTSSIAAKFSGLNIDSLKIEGRMKSSDYVAAVTKEYRNILDNKPRLNKLESVFHRPYTLGFIQNTDKGKIVDRTKKSNEGELVGKILSRKKEYTFCEFSKEIKVTDRIRIEDVEPHYFTIDEIRNLEMKSVKSIMGKCYLKIYKDIGINSLIFRMKDNTITPITNDFKAPLSFIVSGSVGKPLQLSTVYENKRFLVESDELLIESQNMPLTPDILEKQLGKLNDTAFYLKDLQCFVNNAFAKISTINDLRRKLIKAIITSKRIRRELPPKKKLEIIDIDNSSSFHYSCFVTNIEQYNACRKLGMTDIYFENYVPYVNATYPEIKEKSVLIGNYGGIDAYSTKYLTADYSFNVMNIDSLYELYKRGISRITPSLELSYYELVDLVNNYQVKYKHKPNLEVIVYGHINLMTTKYCPLKQFGECGNCGNNSYELRDKNGVFPIQSINCTTHILNGTKLNLIDEVGKLKDIANTLRLQFTIETPIEVEETIKKFQNRLKDLDNRTSYFDGKNETRGYFKRKVL